MNDVDPTTDEIARVRRYDCRRNGHDIEIIYQAQSYDPKLLLCQRCGEQWRPVLVSRELVVGDPSD